MLNEEDKEHARSIVQKALSKQFSPEFLNRLDEIITFDQLDLEAIKRIVDVELKPLVKRIADLGFTIELTDEAKDFLATKGYDVQFGARPLKRALQNYVEDGICELIINGNLPEGSRLQVGKNADKEELTFTVI
jgi:ATP-dependent Clp protease ATP-binding subunit ClpC